MNPEISSQPTNVASIQDYLNSAIEQPRGTPDQIQAIIRKLGTIFSTIQDTFVRQQPGSELALSGLFALKWRPFLADSNFPTPAQRYYFVQQFLQNFSPETYSFSCGLLDALLDQPTILDPSMRDLSKMLIPLFWQKDWNAINSIMELFHTNANDQELNAWLLASIFSHPRLIDIRSPEEMKAFIRSLPAYKALHTEELYLDQLVLMFTNKYESAAEAFDPDSRSKIKLSMVYLILAKKKSLKKMPQSIFLIPSIHEFSQKKLFQKNFDGQSPPLKKAESGSLSSTLITKTST